MSRSWGASSKMSPVRMSPDGPCGAEALPTRHNSALKEDQRFHAKLENLEKVLKHMREVTERRQQLEQEQQQALAILNFKQNEVKRLQRAQFAAKKEQEGVVQMLESSVLELEEKCRTQSQQFTLLSHELERFRLQTGDASDQELCQLTNGVKEPVFTHHASGLARPQWPPAPRRRVLPTIDLKPGSPASTARFRHLAPKPVPLLHHTRKPLLSHEVVASRQVKGLHINASPVPEASGRAAAKLRVFVVKYSYDPYHGPNDNPETELPLKAGEYICLYGDIDEDGFYEGELMDGRRGLVPSNFVELVSGDSAVGFPSPEACDPSCGSPGESGLHGGEGRLHLCADSSERSGPPTPDEGQGPTANGFDAEEWDADAVPYPRRLTLIKRLAKSAVIGWEPPLAPAGWGSVWSYNVYVDKELRLNVPFGAPTKAVLERLDVGLKAYRVSVQSVTERGESDALRCTFLVGRDVCMAPTQLRAERVAPTSVRLTWLPSNSNYTHTVSLSDGERWLVKAGDYSLSLRDLGFCQRYCAKVEARALCTPWELSLYGREHKSASITFSTAATGPPAPPLNVQLEAGPSPGIALISWLPVTSAADGTSNGAPVTGYTIYADKRKVLEVSSPTAGSALMGPSQIHTLQSARELTVRTTSPQGESTDSVPVPVPPNLAAIAAGMALARPTPGGVLHSASPPPEIPTAKLLHGTPADAHAPLAGTSCDTHRAVSTGRAGVISPEHTVSSAEPSSPASPAPGSHREPDPGDTQRSPPEPGTEDGSSRESTRVGSVDEFPDSARLTPGPQYTESQDRSYLKTPQSCGSRLTEAHSDCRVTEEAGFNSDLREDEEGHCSDNPGEDSKTDSDEEILERILRSETPHNNNKELFSIPEVTEEEDSCQEPEDPVLLKSPQIQHLLPGQDKPVAPNSPARHSKSPDGPAYNYKNPESPAHRSMIPDSPAHRSKSPDSPAYCYKSPDSPAHRSAPVTQERSSRAPIRDRHLAPVANTKRKGPEDPKPRQHISRRDPGGDGPYEARDLSRYSTIPQPKTRPRHRVHYSDKVDTFSYQREEYDSDSSVYVPSREARRQRQRSHGPLRQRGAPEKSGDCLRREALLQSQMASHRLASGQYLGGKTVVRTRAPVSSGMEIDVEYGTEDDDEEALPFDPAGVVVEQMSSEWWVLDELRERPGPAPHRPKRQQPVEAVANLHPGYWRRGSAGAPGMGGLILEGRVLPGQGTWQTSGRTAAHRHRSVPNWTRGRGATAPTVNT
ncbi:hypothetical protein AAFF_G00347180 [Aldrovandia affinis]|uniref:RIMS-binding protein 2 n=1 Tax=Aldrovandia affinis TaxID=143900 RepID=A0AAD7SJL3_9TELE|nr:hypothetical protein AAFF_G00347180 [Aldrovandia affinis]